MQKALTVRLTEEQRAYLEKMSKATSRSKGSIIRALIDQDIIIRRELGHYDD